MTGLFSFLLLSVRLQPQAFEGSLHNTFDYVLGVAGFFQARKLIVEAEAEARGVSLVKAMSSSLALCDDLVLHCLKRAAQSCKQSSQRRLQC